MTAHSILLAVLLIACIVTELHPRIRTGLLATILLGITAVVAYLRLTTCSSPAPLFEYLAIGLSLVAVATFACRRYSPRDHAHHLYDPWRIAP